MLAGYHNIYDVSTAYCSHCIVYIMVLPSCTMLMKHFHCGSWFYYTCGVPWKGCGCPLWAEGRLLVDRWPRTIQGPLRQNVQVRQAVIRCRGPHELFEIFQRFERVIIHDFRIISKLLSPQELWLTRKLEPQVRKVALD